jgi:hypothetical protein
VFEECCSPVKRMPFMESGLHQLEVSPPKSSSHDHASFNFSLSI